MKKIKITGALLLALLINASVHAQAVMNVPLSQPGKTFKLDVGLITGSITVFTYDGKDIMIITSADPERKNRVKERADGMRMLSAGNSEEIQAEENNNQVTIHGSPNKKTDLIIKVPQTEATFKLSTVNGGNITASNLNGELEVTNVNGFIKLINISGSVVANTVNGPVIVGFKSIDPKAAMAFSTLNGNVDVTFPAGFKANVKLKTDRGDIYTDFDVVTDPHKPNVTKTSNGGMYSLKIEDWVYGKIDGGGPEILMKNMNGSIYIRKAR